MDGNINYDVRKGYCAHMLNGEDSPYNKNPSVWRVDLEEPHMVEKVILYNRNGTTAAAIMRRMKVYVTDSNVDVHRPDQLDDDELCGEYKDAVPEAGSATIKCKSNTKGRYVYVRNSPEDVEIDFPFKMVICEAVVVGYKPIDCGSCQENTQCSALRGCEICPEGKAKPDCKRCTSDRFGNNCESKCNCRQNSECDKNTGYCAKGCDDFYIHSNCTTYIDYPDMSDSKPYVDIYSPNSVRVFWKQLAIDDSFADYYGYIVEFKTQDTDFVPIEETELLHKVQVILPTTEAPTTVAPTTEAPTTEAPTTNMMNVTAGNETMETTEIFTTTMMPETTEGIESTTVLEDLLPNNMRRVHIAGLQENTQYTFRIRPFREVRERTWNNNIRREGTPSAEFHVKLQSVNVHVTESTTTVTTTPAPTVIVTDAPQPDFLTEFLKTPAIPIMVVIGLLAMIISITASFFGARYKYQKMQVRNITMCDMFLVI